MTEKIAFDTEEEVSDTVRLANSIDSLTEMVERLCDLLEAQTAEKPKKPRVEWHDKFHDDTPFSVLDGWNEMNLMHRNALRDVGCVTFGELKKREDMRIEKFGKKGLEDFKALLERNHVLIEYFPVLN